MHRTSITLFVTLWVCAAAAAESHHLAVDLPVKNSDRRLHVAKAEVDRLIYAPGETGAALVTVINGNSWVQPATLTVTLDGKSLVSRPVKLKPGKSLELKVPFKAQGLFGHELRVTLSAKGLKQVVYDYFSVTDNWYNVCIGSTWGSSLHTGLGKHREIPRAMRKIYSNHLELFFWAPCDWAKLTSSFPVWWSGQADYPQNEANTLELIRMCHALGMKVAFYANCNPSGPFAWDLARKHPQWFSRAATGGFNGQYVVEHLDKWNDPIWRDTKGMRMGDTGWYVVRPNLRNTETLDHGINEIIISAKHYGWDAVRFDGHYTIRGSDELSTWNMRRLKERVWAELPDFKFGFNYGRAPEWRDGVTHEMREAMAGGGLYMQEGIRNWRYTSAQYQTWSHLATNELRVAKLVQSLGGTYQCIWTGHQHTPEQNTYKHIYGLIAGGHPAYGAYRSVEGSPNWGAFMTKYAGPLWDSALTRVEQSESLVDVQASGTLYWKPLVQQRVISEDRRQLIVHLVNPSPDDAIAKTSLPAAISDVKVRIRPPSGETLRSVELARPEALPFGKSLNVSGGVVTVPRVELWAMLIVDLAGEYERPATPSKFTEPADEVVVAQAKKVADTGTAAVDPNKPDEAQINTDPNMQVWETDSGFSGHGVRAIANDADATGGLAQMRDLGEDPGSYPFMGRPYIGPIPPGKHRAIFRIKREADDPNAHNQLYVRVTHHAEDRTLNHIHISTEKYPQPANKLVRFQKEPGYHDYPVEFELKSAAKIQCDFWPVGKIQDACKIYSDHVRIETIKTYADREIAGRMRIKRPADLRKPQGASPKRVLLVKGLFWQLYQPQMIEGVEVEGAYALPEGSKELHAYDALILANVNVSSSSFESRAAIYQWVRRGGRLTILGGSETLGQGGMPNTYFDDLLPMKMLGANEVIQCSPPEMLSMGDRSAGGQIYYRHDIALRAKAKPLAWVGDQPIAASRRLGSGSVYAFAGTVLGDGDGPFWLTETWKQLLTRMVTSNE